MRKKQNTDIFTLPITNWVFFIPLVYLLILLIWGIIYSASRDQSDFKLITQYEESVSQQENVLTVNSIIFYKKMIF